MSGSREVGEMPKAITELLIAQAIEEDHWRAM
jgi:hypothetical protein